MEKIRLQKIFTDFGIMSRRACEKEIEAGHVTVNGQVAHLGDRADPECDIIEYKGRRIGVPRESRTYIMLNKPMGYVTTMSDEKGRRDVAELITDVGCRVYPVGRLDMYSEGLLLFTDDGELANRLTHPSHGFGKVYRVKVKGEVTKEDMEKLLSPMELDGYSLRPIEAVLVASGRRDREGNLCSVLEITLHEGRNRQIRKMCEKCGLSIMRLCRIRLGEIELGSLPRGKWRHLTEEEVSYLLNH